MRTRALLVLTIAFVAAGCTSPRPSATPKPPLAPLAACESRNISVDGAALVLTSNADATLATIRVLNAPTKASRRGALEAVHAAFGAAHLDTIVIARPSKWGLATWTDRCGRPITATSSQAPAPR